MFKYVIAVGLAAGLSLNLYSQEGQEEKTDSADKSQTQKQNHKVFSTQSFNDGKYQVRVVTEGKEKKITVKQGDKVIVENLPWSKRDTLPEEVQTVLKKMTTGVKISVWGDGEMGDVEVEIENIFKNFHGQMEGRRKDFEDMQKEFEDMQKEMEKNFPRDRNWKERGRAVIELDKMFGDLFKDVHRAPNFRMSNRYNRAFELFQNRDFKKSVKLFLEVAGKTLSLDLKQSSYYNAACAYALLGDKAQAVTCLKAAFSAGYGDLEHLMQDDDLKSLRDSDFFKSVTEPYIALKKAQEAYKTAIDKITTDENLMAEIDALFGKELGIDEVEEDIEAKKEDSPTRKLK